jgi:predicted GNAT superfamily acetyltransferase
MIIKSIETLGEMRGVEELQKEVWGPEDVVPLTHLIAAREVGCSLIGAFDGPKLVGFVYGFIGLEDGRLLIHSHMLAVKPAWRDHHLGYRLKLAQREQALAQGFARITWTFDPLQSRNAYLNFAKLGGVAHQYKINFYGEESPSPLHSHIGTDRLWVTWLPASERVRRRLATGAGGLLALLVEMEKTITLVEADTNGAPVRREKMEELRAFEYALIEIPADIGSLQQHNPAGAADWRKATRRAFTEALASGYLVEEFYRRTRNGQQIGVYLLRRGRTVDEFI